MSISIEDLDKALTHKNISYTPFCNPGDAFARGRDVTICGDYYEIEWWSNICYLKHGDMTIPFYSVKQINTWPNHSKMNLQFTNCDGDTCCIIPIEKYDEAAS